MSINNLPKFIINTEYAALKNFPATVTATITIAAGGTILAGNYVRNQTLISPTNISIPKGAPLQVDISTSINPDISFQESVLQFTEDAGTALPYDGFVLVTLNAENEIAVNVSLYNPNGVNVSTNARTITVKIRSFEPPFS